MINCLSKKRIWLQSQVLFVSVVLTDYCFLSILRLVTSARGVTALSKTAYGNIAGASFEELLRVDWKLLFSLTRRIVEGSGGTPQDTEDIFATACANACEAFERTAAKGLISFKGWFVRIVKNLWISEGRSLRRKRTLYLEDFEDPDSERVLPGLVVLDSAEEVLHRLDCQERCKPAVSILRQAGLNSGEMVVFWLKTYEDWDDDKIRVHLNIPKGSSTAKTRLFRARRKIKAAIAEQAITAV